MKTIYYSNFQSLDCRERVRERERERERVRCDCFRIETLNYTHALWLYITVIRTFKYNNNIIIIIMHKIIVNSITVMDIARLHTACSRQIG